MNLLNKVLHFFMLITGHYEIEAIKKLRNDPNYDYYGNYIGENINDEHK